MKPMLTHYLAQIPYINILPPAPLQKLARQASYRTFAPNELIFLEGDSSAGLWIVEQGSIKVSKFNPDGTEFILRFLGIGDTFNDIPALDGQPNPANATALTEASCWVISHQVIAQALDENPIMARAVIKMLTNRVRLLIRQLEDLALYSAASRLARYLLDQAENPTNPDGVTRAAIAAHLATTPETISRALRSFEEAGAIQFNRHKIEIVRADILQAIALL